MVGGCGCAKIVAPTDGGTTGFAQVQTLFRSATRQHPQATKLKAGTASATGGVGLSGECGHRWIRNGR